MNQLLQAQDAEQCVSDCACDIAPQERASIFEPSPNVLARTAADEREAWSSAAARRMQRRWQSRFGRHRYTTGRR